jgi:hypothetical protein
VEIGIAHLFWAVFTFGGSGSALTALGALDLKQEIQIQICIAIFSPPMHFSL